MDKIPKTRWHRDHVEDVTGLWGLAWVDGGSVAPSAETHVAHGLVLHVSVVPTGYYCGIKGSGHKDAFNTVKPTLPEAVTALRLGLRMLAEKLIVVAAL